MTTGEGSPRPRVARAQGIASPPFPSLPLYSTSLVLAGVVRWSLIARINDPSKLARFSSYGMAPVLVPLRPSSEHILIVRAPGARDRHGCHSIHFYRGASASKEDCLTAPVGP